MYSRPPSSGFGKPAAAKPRKRPTQARAVFTVQAIYDAFVRIWRQHGWAGVTTRAVALETGFSHQSHLARWMRRLRGATPAAFLRDGVDAAANDGPAARDLVGARRAASNR